MDQIRSDIFFDANRCSSNSDYTNCTQENLITFTYTIQDPILEGFTYEVICSTNGLDITVIFDITVKGK